MARLCTPALLRPVVRFRTPRLSCPKYRCGRYWPSCYASSFSQSTNVNSRTSTISLAVLLSTLTCGGLTLAVADSPKGLAESVYSTLFTAADTSTLTTTERETVSKGQTYGCKYLICGAGIAAASAVRALVEKDPNAELLVVAPECREGFCRSHESKEDSKNIWNSSSRKFLLGESITGINTRSRKALTSLGSSITFKECLVAVGVEMDPIPEELVLGKDAKPLVADASTIKGWLQIESSIKRLLLSNGDNPHVTILGSGWFACRTANELLQKGADLTFVFSEPVILARYLPRYLSDEVLARFRYYNPNIDFVPYSAVRYIMNRPSGSGAAQEAEVTISRVFDAYEVDQFRTDLVVCAPTEMKMKPIDDLGSSLQMDSGFLVSNTELSVASNIYGAGSCIMYPSIGGHRCSSWSEIHAEWSGRHAALNMLGGRAPYKQQPPVVINLSTIGVKIHILGKVNSSFQSLGFFNRVSHQDRRSRLAGGSLGNGVVFFTEPVSTRTSRTKKYRLLGVLVYEGDSLCSSCVSKKTTVESVLDMIKHEPQDRKPFEKRLKDIATELLNHPKNAEPLLARIGQPRKVPLSQHETFWMSDVRHWSYKRESPRERYHRMLNEFYNVPKVKSRDGTSPS